jgi:hypothetical protein
VWGLKSKPELNGQRATVIEILEQGRVKATTPPPLFPLPPRHARLARLGPIHTREGSRIPLERTQAPHRTAPHSCTHRTHARTRGTNAIESDKTSASALNAAAT